MITITTLAAPIKRALVAMLDLPAELAQELTAAIDEVVAALREKEVLP